MFQMPREFRNLSFYVCDAGGIRDARIGKVAISKELLMKEGITEDTWIPIRAIDADTEVQVRFTGDYWTQLHEVAFLPGLSPLRSQRVRAPSQLCPHN